MEKSIFEKRVRGLVKKQALRIIYKDIKKYNHYWVQGAMQFIYSKEGLDTSSLRYPVAVYYKREKERNIKEENRLSLKEVTIFQPVLSGDSYLKEKLSIIYNTAKEAELIWAVDEDDNEAEKIINEITGNNPKKYLRVIKCSRAPF